MFSWGLCWIICSKSMNLKPHLLNKDDTQQTKASMTHSVVRSIWNGLLIPSYATSIILQPPALCHLYCLSPPPSVSVSLLSSRVSSVINGAQSTSCPAATTAFLTSRAKRPQQRNERSCCSMCLKNKSSLSRADTLQADHIYRLDPKSDGKSDTPAVTVISTIYWTSSERWEYQLCKRWTTQSVTLTVSYNEICKKKKNLLSPSRAFCSLQQRTTSGTSNDCGKLTARLHCG